MYWKFISKEKAKKCDKQHTRKFFFFKDLLHCVNINSVIYMVAGAFVVVIVWSGFTTICAINAYILYHH